MDTQTFRIWRLFLLNIDVLNEHLFLLANVYCASSCSVPVCIPPVSWETCWSSSIISISPQFRDKGVTRGSAKCLAQVQVDKSALPLSTSAGAPPWKATEFARHDLPLVKPRWLSPVTSLFSTCLSTVFRRMEMIVNNHKIIVIRTKSSRAVLL